MIWLAFILIGAAGVGVLVQAWHEQDDPSAEDDDEYLSRWW